MRKETLAEKGCARVATDFWADGRIVEVIRLGRRRKETFIIAHMPNPHMTGGSRQRLTLIYSDGSISHY